MQKEKKVSLVIIDDDKLFVNALTTFFFADKEVEIFYSPDEFLNNISKYAENSEDILFCIDNNFENSSLKGFDLAKKLHEMGLKKLYLLSGESIESVNIPNYLVVISKTDLDSIESLGNL